MEEDAEQSFSVGISEEIDCLNNSEEYLRKKASSILNDNTVFGDSSPEKAREAPRKDTKNNKGILKLTDFQLLTKIERANIKVKEELLQSASDDVNVDVMAQAWDMLQEREAELKRLEQEWEQEKEQKCRQFVQAHSPSPIT